MADPPEVTILLLGDAECGKSIFLSYVTPFRFKPLFVIRDVDNSPKSQVPI